MFWPTSANPLLLASSFLSSPCGPKSVFVGVGVVVGVLPSAGPPMFRFFSSLSRLHFDSFSGGVFALNFGGVLEGLDNEMFSLFPLFCRVLHDSPRTPNVHKSRPRNFKHHQNSTRRPPREKKMKIVAGEGKKREIFGPPTLRSPTLRPPSFWVWAFLSRSSPPHFGTHPSGPFEKNNVVSKINCDCYWYF